MLNDEGYIHLQHILNNIPNKYHFRLHFFNNIEFRRKWVVPERILPDYLISFIKSGNGYYTFEDGTKEDVYKDKLIIISRDYKHSALGSDDVPDFYSIRFGIYDNITELEIKEIDNTFAFGYFPSNSKYYRDLFEKLYNLNLSNPNSPYLQKISNSIICEIMSQICIELSKCNNNKDLSLESAVIYATRYIADGVTVDKLAEISGLSKDYFSRKFKKAYGISPKSFITDCKLNYAKALISNYHYSVQEAAFETGYSDQYLFSNQFKKHFGYPPSKAKKSVQF